ncbi:serine hydrolase [Pelomonas sp. KK5]|uniref:serine hydrolase domain-containing protein n=1 Tax=Pelomonas sp. KK5 TaxID=1855730 RepID=UPI00097BDEA5|nr:serine hydrolase domain-containing protein [Pelomonas sp. KK5]
MNESTAPETKAAKTGVAALDGIFQVANKADAPGLVVGVAQHGKTVYRRGFGLASIELGVANTAWTRMRIGSTTKHFTCLAALLLVEEGKLDIDVGVRTYLPELPKLAKEPTLRQFMSHTGGYRCYLDVGFMSDGMAIKPKGVALHAQLRQSEVNFAPGEMMIYNNGGYHMLSLVIERVSGMKFERFLEERIFTPLGMIDTRCVQSDFEIHPNMATLHVAQPDGSWRRGIFPTEENRGEGSMISTIDDMLRWLAHLRGPHRVGTDASWKQMTTTVPLSSGTPSPYALGLMVHDYRGVRVIQHSGSVIGGTCQMITVPAHELDVIIMTNGAVVNAIELANKVIDAMLGDEVLGPVEERATAERFKAVLDKHYLSPETGLVVGFADADGKLGLTVMNSAPVPLRDEGETLRIGIEDLAMGPFQLTTAALADLETAPAEIELAESGWKRRLQLLPDAPPADAAAPLAGRYHARDLGVDAQVLLNGDTWTLRVAGDFAVNDMVLTALSADVFALSLPEFPKMRMVLGVDRHDGAVTGFRVDSGRTRHMRFQRIEA